MKMYSTVYGSRISALLHQSRFGSIITIADLDCDEWKVCDMTVYVRIGIQFFYVTDDGVLKKIGAYTNVVFWHPLQQGIVVVVQEDSLTRVMCLIGKEGKKRTLRAFGGDMNFCPDLECSNFGRDPNGFLWNDTRTKIVWRYVFEQGAKNIGTFLRPCREVQVGAVGAVVRQGVDFYYLDYQSDLKKLLCRSSVSHWILAQNGIVLMDNNDTFRYIDRFGKKLVIARKMYYSHAASTVFGVIIQKQSLGFSYVSYEGKETVLDIPCFETDWKENAGGFFFVEGKKLHYVVLTQDYGIVTAGT